MLKFYWNGIKEDGGKLQRCSYHMSALLNHPEGTITIYSKRYRDFSKGIHAEFIVENGTDITTDYFEDDRIRVEPSHPLYAEVKAACQAYDAHFDKMETKRTEKRAAYRQAA